MPLTGHTTRTATAAPRCRAGSARPNGSAAAGSAGNNALLALQRIRPRNTPPTCLEQSRATSLSSGISEVSHACCRIGATSRGQNVPTWHIAPGVLDFAREMRWSWCATRVIPPGDHRRSEGQCRQQPTPHLRPGGGAGPGGPAPHGLEWAGFAGSWSSRTGR